MSKLTTRDLEIEKRMDKVANIATKKAQQQQIDIPVVPRKLKRIALNLDPINLDKRDTEIERRMDSISKVASIDSGNEILSPIETGITPEMIEQNRKDEQANKLLVLPSSFIPELEDLPEDDQTWQEERDMNQYEKDKFLGEQMNSSMHKYGSMIELEKDYEEF